MQTLLEDKMGLEVKSVDCFPRGAEFNSPASIYNEIWYPIYNEIWNLIYNEIWNPIYNDIWHPLFCIHTVERQNLVDHGYRQLVPLEALLIALNTCLASLGEGNFSTEKAFPANSEGKKEDFDHEEDVDKMEDEEEPDGEVLAGMHFANKSYRAQKSPTEILSPFSHKGG
ncbi:hypothetical protein STEG23_029084 [Scotinomys teguina]